MLNFEKKIGDKLKLHKKALKIKIWLQNVITPIIHDSHIF